MAKEPKKAKRKIKDLEPDATKGAGVKGGFATPVRKGLIESVLSKFRVR